MKQILLSIRMLLRFKVYTFVNFIGLAISLACVFTITRYIHQENTVDHCYPEYKRIYLSNVLSVTAPKNCPDTNLT